MLSFSPSNRLKDASRNVFVVPRSISLPKPDYFANAGLVEVVRFEPGSRILRFGTGLFSHCLSLKSICIPASVEYLGWACFTGLRDRKDADRLKACRLENVEFEPGSRLREIESDAFLGCSWLTHLCIPGSVEKLTGASFPDSRKCRIEIDSMNCSFHLTRDCVLHFSRPRLVRYCGMASEMTIPDEIQTIDERAFGFCHSIRYLKFGPMSRLSSIGRLAFTECVNLTTITIPASVTLLGDQCFSGCLFLETVSFCSGSQLKHIPESAFAFCRFVTSITLPASVKTLGARCFSQCPRLANSPLPVDSEVVRIRERAFAGCCSLQSMVLPSSLALLGRSCFEGCTSLVSLTFASPSHLRELLDLPPVLTGVIAIPDSVEVFSLCQKAAPLPDRTMVFGPDSRLAKFSLKSARKSRHCRAFGQVSTRTLKIIRAGLEFASSASHPPFRQLRFG
jgi:hypothetical protein